MSKVFQLAVEAACMAAVAGAVALFMLAAAGVFGEQERSVSAKTGAQIVVNEQRLVDAVGRTK